MVTEYDVEILTMLACKVYKPKKKYISGVLGWGQIK